MTRGAFLDTSVLIDALVPDHPDHHERAADLIRQVGAGALVVHISHTVLFEAAYVLSKTYHIPRNHVADELTNLLKLEILVLPDKPLMVTTLRLWSNESALSFADCYHLVLAESLGLDAIYAFDREMGRYPGVERLEP